MKRKSLLINTVLFAMGSFGSRVLTFLLVPLYTNYLSTVEYGEADLIVTTYTLIMFIFTLSIFDAIFPYVIENKESSGKILAFSAKVLFIGFCFLLVILWLVCMVYSQISVATGVYIFCGAVVNAFNRLFGNFLQANDRVKQVVVAGFLQTAVMLVCNIIFITVFYMGMHGYLLSIIFGGLISCVYEIIILRNDFSFHKKNKLSNSVKKAIIFFSIPFIFNNICWWINSSIDKYFIAVFCGTGQNGLYSVAAKIPNILTMMVSFFLQAWGISSIQEFDPEDKDGFFANTYNTFNTFVVLMCSVIILLNRPIAQILFAKEFFEAWEFSGILLLSSLVNALSGFIGSIFSAVKDSKMFAISTIIGAIINTILNMILIPKLEVFGAAIATVISFVFVWGIRLYKSYKYISWKLEIKKHILCYILLVIQVICSLVSPGRYIMQLAILAVLLFFNRERIKIIYGIGYKKLRGLKHENKRAE